MDYPFWDAGVGYGVLMASIAILHVFISQFAIGGGLYLVVTETRMRKQGDAAGLDFLHRLTRFFVLVTVVLGAVTGVGIWFIIGLLNPAATEVLIHNFVWGWAIEWTFFVVEIAAAIFYYYGFKTLPAKTHLIIGWIYFAAAWLSLAVINGILSFMLTPGQWLKTGSFWDGFLNPTYLPTLVFRTGIALLLAGLYTLLVSTRLPKGALKTRIVRWNTGWGLAGLIVMAPTFYWFVRAIPKAQRLIAFDRLPMPEWAMHVTFVFAGGLAFLLLIALLTSRRWVSGLAVLLMLVGFGEIGSFEVFRESARKPWIIANYMYGQGVVVGDVKDFQKTGYLAHITYRTGDDGLDLFDHACHTCHTVDGYKALAPHFAHTDVAFAEGLVKGVGVMKPHMPPFMGTPAEAKTLAAWIWKHVDHTPLDEATNLKGVALGQKVFEVRCGTCHQVGGYKDISQSFADMGPDEVGFTLQSLSDLDASMPAFTGDEVQKQALVEYLIQIGKQSKTAVAKKGGAS